LTTLDVELATAIAGFKGQWLALDSVASLDPATAKTLAAFGGQDMLLNGLMTLDVATATALATFGGRQVSLIGLTTLSFEAATALAKIGGSLYVTDELEWGFRNENPLSASTVAAWVALSRGNLAGVTDLDSPDAIAIARALAGSKGTLRLPDLKRISRKTLRVLVEKPDVEIPPIKTLDWIPEPDGSDDDFVIPEWLENGL
jgi:hypothetical protein